jgi:putative Holliday junction resolvase
VRALIARERVSALVVGLPLDSLGNEGEACAKVRRYVQQLKLPPPLALVFLDERYTSAACRHAFKQMNVSAARQQREKDSGAASLILQNALDIAYAHITSGRS